jgi:hypothetical protein
VQFGWFPTFFAFAPHPLPQITVSRNLESKLRCHAIGVKYLESPFFAQANLGKITDPEAMTGVEPWMPKIERGGPASGAAPFVGDCGI